MKKKIIIASVLIALSVILVFVMPNLFKKSLKDSLASVLNVKKENLILNLPPSPSRFPGSILLPYDDSYLIYSLNDSLDQNLIRGKKFSIDAKVENFESIKSIPKSGIMKTVFANEQNFEVNIVIHNGQILEIPIKLLKEYVNGNTDIKVGANEKRNAIILHRAYQGIISYVVKAKNEKAIELITQLNDQAVELSKRNPEFSVDAKITDDKQITFKISDPIIIAFEALSVDFVATNLSSELVEPVFTPITFNELEKIRISNVKKESAKQEKKSWGLVTIGSGHFDYLSTINVPEAIDGVNAVSNVLKSYSPSFHKNLVSTEENTLSDDEIVEWTIGLTMEMLNDPVDYLVIYYAGHGLSLPNGEITLLQGNLKKDYAETALDNLDTAVAHPDDGNLLVQTLYDSFDITGIPFTILLDACYPSEEMQNALKKVSMTLGSVDGSNLLYFGDKALITTEMSEISDVLWNIGNRFEYRTSTNPIIFSSKPGAKAVFVSNPVNYYGNKLPPIAARISKYFQFNVPSNRMSLGQLISNTIDFKSGIGEVSLSGTISWSDLDNMNTSLEDIYSK